MPALAPTFQFDFKNDHKGTFRQHFNLPFTASRSVFFYYFESTAQFLTSSHFQKHPYQYDIFCNPSSVIAEICQICHLSAMTDDGLTDISHIDMGVLGIVWMSGI